MKKYFLFLFLLSAILANAQTQAFQTGRYAIVRNTATTNVTPITTTTPAGTMERFDVRTGTVEGQGTLLLTIVDRFFFYFNATPALADITQEATSGGWKIAIPASPTTNKSIFMPDKGIAVVYSGTKYGFDWNPTNPFPLEIRNTTTSQLMCTIYADGNVLWPDVSVRTASAISTTGLVQYTIN